MIIPIFIQNFGGSEILIIALVVLVLFGAKKIPEFMKGIGRGVKNFKDGMKDIQEEIASDKESEKSADK